MFYVLWQNKNIFLFFILFFVYLVKFIWVYTLAIPITPQPTRAPALPVVLLSSWPPVPKSSGSACTTNVRPIILCSPLSEIWESVMLTLPTPFASATTFPKSPTCRMDEVGPPCSFPWGLKWAPAERHPLVVSPNSWTWKPWKPSLRPVISPDTTTGPSPVWNFIDI